MNENENNFESLRRLLALKRHETPPPGYFENFSSDVMARIRAGEARQAKSAGRQLPWLLRLLSAFEAKPAFAGAFASALCMLLLFGVVFAERPDLALQQPLLPSASIGGPLAVVTPDSLGAAAKSASFAPLSADQPAVIPISSTNPVFSSQSSGSWLATQGSQEATVQPASFTFPGN